MTLEDKGFLLQILQMPRLRLSQAQVSAIERVIDTGMAPPAYATYGEAMSALGFTTAAGIRKLIHQGHLVAVKMPGRKHALGVTRDSLRGLVESRAAGGV